MKEAAAELANEKATSRAKTKEKPDVKPKPKPLKPKAKPKPAATTTGKPTVLDVLCLHGDHQTGEIFRGRLVHLIKKLRPVARLTFIDAPYELPIEVRSSIPMFMLCSTVMLLLPDTHAYAAFYIYLII